MTRGRGRGRLHRALGLLAVLGAGAAPAGAGQGIGLLDAAQATLKQQPRVLLGAQQLESSRAGLRAAKGQFDFTVKSEFDRIHSDTPNTEAQIQFQRLPDSTVTDNVIGTVSGQKQFRTGLTVIPSASVTRTALNVSPTDTNAAGASLLVVQPLLRGRGSEAVAVGERTSQIDVNATGFDLRQTRASAVLSTVTFYWNYLAAQKRLVIAQNSETRARRILEETKVLIELGNRPAAEIKQADANVSDRVSSRIAAEQSVYQARQNLGLAMGLPADQIETLPLPGDDFPAIPEEAAPAPAEVLIDTALDRRADLRSARLREDQSEALIAASRNGLKPQLDLVASGGYSGLREGTGFGNFFGSLYSQVPGANAQLTISFSYPVSNNSAHGRYAQNLSSWEQAKVRSFDLQRSIRTAVAYDRDDVEKSAQRVRNSQKAAQLYGSSVEDEREKHKLGTSTVIDLINTEDRLDRTLQDEVAAQASYANAVARLRYDTGTLLSGEGETVELQALITVPTIGLGAPAPATQER